MNRFEDKKLAKIILAVSIVVIVLTMAIIKPIQFQVLHALVVAFLAGSFMYYFYTRMKPWDSIYSFNQYAQAWLSFFVGDIVGNFLLERYGFMDQPQFGLFLLTIFTLATLGIFVYVFDFIYTRLLAQNTTETSC